MNNDFIKLFISDAGVLKDNGFTDIYLVYNSNGYSCTISLSALYNGKRRSISKKFSNRQAYTSKADIQHYDIYQFIRTVK